MKPRPDPKKIQEAYYAATANAYNSSHLGTEDEHAVALYFLLGMLPMLNVNSILDVGSGTGRALLKLKAAQPSLQVMGIEPVEQLRTIGINNGLTSGELISGDATQLQFANNSFDLVCEFGVLHHVQKPDVVIAEMLRVARKAIFISDSNNFGQGGTLARYAKQAIHGLGLWPMFNLMKTRGKGYTITKGDGLAYSYSVFDNYKQIKAACKKVYLFNTQGAGASPYHEWGHIALLGVL